MKILRNSKGQFLKGTKIHLGRKRSAEVKKKLSDIKLSKPVRYWLGKKRPDISGEKYWSWKGGVTKILSNCLSCGIKVKNYRNKYCKDCSMKGKNSWSWKGGISNHNEKIRKSIRYKKWRIAVFTRDDYTCQICGQKGKELHADHIKKFADYPQFRLNISNGRTLCIYCHRKTDTYSWRKAATI